MISIVFILEDMVVLGNNGNHKVQHLAIVTTRIQVFVMSLIVSIFMCTLSLIEVGQK